MILIGTHPASAQGLVEYFIPEIDGTIGDNDWFTSDVSVTWPVTTEMTVINGCNDTLINQDTSSEGITLYCFVEQDGEYFNGEIVIKRDTTQPVVATNLPTDTPLSLDEGSSFQVDASSSIDDASGVASIQWSLDGDGLFNDGNPVVYQALDGLANAEANPYLLAVQVIDQAGNVAEAAFPIVVHNLPPVFDPLQDIGLLYGTYNLTAPFTDPGILDTHTSSIDWGDDTLETGVILESGGSGFLHGDHTYNRRGAYTLTLTLQDKDGAVITTTQRVNVDSTSGVSLPIAASFTHVSGSTVYNTVFNQISPLLLYADDTQAEAVLGLDPGGCPGMQWFETGGTDPQSLGYMAICLTDPSASAADFNTWLADDQGLPGPELHIPLELSSIGPGMAQVWTNPDPLTAGVFVQAADDSLYRHYADLVFPPGEFSLTTGIETTYRPYVSLSATPSLSNIDPTTWNWIQTTFDPDDQLPAVSAPGTLVEFSGDPLPVILDPDTLSGRMSLLQDSIGTYTYDGILPLETNLQLNQVLLKVVKAWSDLRDGKALHELNKFIADVDHLVDLGQLSIDESLHLVGEAGTLIDRMLDWENPGELDPDPSTSCDNTTGSCPTTQTYEDCLESSDYIRLSVNSPPLPLLEPYFSSIADALAYAESVNACGVFIYLGPGIYTDDLSITRHTKIWGEGTGGGYFTPQIQGLISNQGPYVLEISGVKIIGNPLGQPSGIYVDHPCAKVYLGGVEVQDVYGFGIRQEGGSLYGNRVTVQGTKATPEYLTHGTGIYLACGVRARLNDVKLIGNQSTGLQVVGARTHAEIHNLKVEDTGMHPSYLATAESKFVSDFNHKEIYAPILGTGGVHVRDGATLWVVGFKVRDNLSTGINVTSGAQARFFYGDVSGTRFFRGVNAVGEWLAGHGHNILSTYTGNLRLSDDFDVWGAELCGISIALNGEVDLERGEVRNNPAGACLNSGYDLRRLSYDVNFHDNGTNIWPGTLITPEAPDTETYR